MYVSGIYTFMFAKNQFVDNYYAFVIFVHTSGNWLLTLSTSLKTLMQICKSFNPKCT
ncbi:hypothetical protein CR513_54413 [Mucuna pruriens]|uniref:Uncharacterized protein n=1 Tax=Mucuna pruriens TaxID=157652 RepID=A0A371EL54_MUCPR|nr:hypothetical protein CR513_54413 [Mucuna pruriens]